MTSITAPKSGSLNWLEGVALTAALQGLPIFAVASLAVKLLGARGSSPVLTVTIATVLYSLFVTSVGLKFPKIAGGVYEALFFDRSLPLSEKVARWRAKPATSMQLMASVLVLSLLATVTG